MGQSLQKLIFTLFLWGAGVGISSAQSSKVFFVGHSLSDQIPDMVQSLSNDHPEMDFDWVYQWIPGAPLRWQWQRKSADDYNPSPPHYYGFYHPTHGLRSGTHNTLVLTEGVPRSAGPWGIEETMIYADSFYRYATDFMPMIRVFINEVWHCIQSGTPTGCDYDVDSNPWRQRLTDDLQMWESVVEYLNHKYSPQIPVCLIPAGQGLARLHDEIEQGTVPGLTSVYELFSDDIHLNDIGKYFVACIHFAMIHNSSPVGLTHQLNNWWGGGFEAPELEQARRFQEIALMTVLDYPNTCFKGGTSSTAALTGSEIQSNVFPNPASTNLQIDISEGSIWAIYDSQGRKILIGKERTINLSSLPSGLYFIHWEGTSRSFYKN